MKSVGAGPAGYTILEVMIFLAVSGVMFLIAIAFINGKQAQAEYSQSVGDVSSHLQQVLNNVMNGFYPSNQNFTCTGGSGSGVNGGPVISSASGSAKGTNQGCVYIGEVVQFGMKDANGNSTRGQGYVVIPVVANQTWTPAGGSAQSVDSFGHAYPTALSDGVQMDKLLYGMHVTNMYLMDGNTKLSNISSFGVFTTFGGYTGSSLNSGAQSIRLATIPGSGYTDGGGYIEGPLLSQAEANISGLREKPDHSLNTDDTYVLTSSQYVTICLKSGYDKPASVSLGNTKGNLSVATQTGASVAGVCLS